MKTLHLSVVIVASALSLATANAMPDLGRETGRFIRQEQPTPKNVRTFEPAKAKDSKTDLAVLVPFRPPHLAVLVPFRPRNGVA
jgi:hypothetical protein